MKLETRQLSADRPEVLLHEFWALHQTRSLPRGAEASPSATVVLRRRF